MSLVGILTWYVLMSILNVCIVSLFMVALVVVGMSGSKGIVSCAVVFVVSSEGSMCCLMCSVIVAKISVIIVLKSGSTSSKFDSR